MSRYESYVTVPTTGEVIQLAGRMWNYYDPCENWMAKCTAVYDRERDLVHVRLPSGEGYTSNVELFLFENGYEEQLGEAGVKAALDYLDMPEESYAEYLEQWHKTQRYYLDNPKAFDGIDE